VTPTDPRALPDGLFLIPALRVGADDQGNAIDAARVLLTALPDGTLVAEVFTSPERLVAARGDAQPWAALHPGDLASILDAEGVDGVVVDPGSPDAHILTPDGERIPLQGGPSGTTA